MKQPTGGVTAAQFEILQVFWDCGRDLTVTEIWEEIAARRKVGRTTILNLVDRLEKRGWLTREKVEGLFRYRPAIDRAETESLLASSFVSDFFSGSPSNFLLSLLGSSSPSPTELQRLRQLLDESSPASPASPKQE